MLNDLVSSTDRRPTPRTGRPYLDALLDQPGAVLAFAHRGGAEHPDVVGMENTTAAFRSAVAQGYQYLETDVHLTRDGVLLAFHDDVLDRVTDAAGRIAAMTHAEVATARIGGVEEVPTLARLFDEFPDARFNIDIKADGAGQALASFLDARDAHDRVLVGSFSVRRLREFRHATGGRVATSAGPWEVAVFRLCPSGRLADRITRGQVDALQIPHRQRGVSITTAGLIRRAHAAGKHVHVWTIDDPAEMAELVDLGVDGLMTDRTDLLKTVLAERGQWRDAR